MEMPYFMAREQGHGGAAALDSKALTGTWKARRPGEMPSGHDSMHASPEAVSGPDAPDPGPRARSSEDSRTDLRFHDRRVAITMRTPALQAHVRTSLVQRDVVVGGPEFVARAALVVAEAGSDVGADMADIRRRARPDAAVLLVLGSASADAVAQAHQAGAFACLRPPLVIEELYGLVSAALDSRAARVQAADLARKLDLESHLASIGRFSAGLSHEVSTPLGAATLNMETVRRECARLVQALKWIVHSPPRELEERIAIAREHIAEFESQDGLAGAVDDTVAAHERLRALFATMRGLIGRAREVRAEPVELMSVVHDVRKWLADDLRGVEVELVGDSVRALADRTMLEQIVQNLVSNAAHAAKSLAAPRIRLHVYARGSRVLVSVRDNGPGIPLDLQERIFEPFFTTRRGRGGTGLGLALCREYARQLEAELSVWSLPGRGACFRVSLLAA
jgi:signal transduction histidine kinase